MSVTGIARSAVSVEPLDWRLGPAAWSFRLFTFFEAIDKTAELGLRYLEAFEGQRVSQEINQPMTADLPDEALSHIARKLKAANVSLVSIYIHQLPSEAAHCRQTFEFARKLGVEMIVSEPAPEALDLIERLCDEFGINVAIHNHAQGISRYWHPQEVLKVCAGRNRRLGACADVGHWQRSGIQPAEGVRLLGDRLLAVHVKDLDQLSPHGHDVPWGTGKGGIGAMLQEIHRAGLKPALFAIEYEYNWEDNIGEIARCVTFFNQSVRELGTATAPQNNH